MAATSLSGRELAASIRAQAAAAAAAQAEAGIPAQLAIVIPTNDESSAWYVRSTAKAAQQAGITCTIHDCTAGDGRADAPVTAIREKLNALSADDAVHGIILQTPLPAGAKGADLASLIAPGKDVDGASPESLGRLAAGLPAFPPATAEAVLAILEHYDVRMSGVLAAVVGRSTVVGKPAALLLLDRNATVTICHSRTPDLAAVTSQADIVVAAVGRAGLLTAEYVKPGAVVVDVGTNVTADGSLAGDVDAGSVAEKAGALTPVPGGVGPVTTSLLLRHTVQAAAGLLQARA
jgi:methylenetetrahydrofolate dehydrogenase (NADP+) / methenyltetrahydrofolate cyclohydrolase